MHSLIRNMKKREGFTLIELMIVVAIIGILAAIAIPNFIKFQLRSKAGEGKINLAGIRTAEESYFADAGTYLDFPESPAAMGGQLKVPFGAAPLCPSPLPAESSFQYLSISCCVSQFTTNEIASVNLKSGPPLSAINGCPFN